MTRLLGPGALPRYQRQNHRRDTSPPHNCASGCSSGPPQSPLKFVILLLGERYRPFPLEVVVDAQGFQLSSMDSYPRPQGPQLLPRTVVLAAHSFLSMHAVGMLSATNDGAPTTDTDPAGRTNPTRY